MIPRRPFTVLVLLLTGFGVLAAFYPLLNTAWLIAAAILLAAAAIDFLLAMNLRPPEVERNVPASVSLSTWVDVHLTFRNTQSRGTMRLRVYDFHPQTVTAEGLPRDLAVDAGHFVDMTYSIRPSERGPMTFTSCELRIASPMRLWWRRRIVDAETEVRTYPNYNTISKLLAFEVDNRLQLAGVRLTRRRGQGIEFEQLRDYRHGDSLRSIDWKATARVQRLIAREYQDERDQQIVFMLDAGRRMIAKDAELSHFDHALNAMLLLSYVALNQGDAAGVMTVAENRKWLPPMKGVGAINGILNHVYDTQPQPIEIDYVAAATELAVRQRRRSLIIILTNVREEDSQDLHTATELLKRRHLVILGSLRERVLDKSLDKSIHGFDDALLYAATNQYLESRRASQDLLRARGIFVEDCLSDELPAQITNRYLAIKRSGML
ncbi:MAG: DUF58 domain-containing protein [Woeseiaceae bacterium]